MPIEFGCPSCGQRYRVSDQMAGRTAVCRHCNAKMSVPAGGGAGTAPTPAGRAAASPPSPPTSGPRMPSPRIDAPGAPGDDGGEIRLVDADSSTGASTNPGPAAARPGGRVDPPPRPSPRQSFEEEDDGSNDPPDLSSFAEDEGDVSEARHAVPDRARFQAAYSGSDEPRRGRRGSDDGDDEAERREPAVKIERGVPLVPAPVAEVYLPWALIVVGLGLAAYTAITHALKVEPVGYSIAAVALGAVFMLLIVWPLTTAAVRSSARKLDFEPSDALRLQTLGLLAVPTSSMCLGYALGGGVSGAVGWGIMSLFVLGGLFVIMMPVSVPRAVMTMVMAALSYAFGAALSLGLVAGVLFVTSKLNIRMPWSKAPEIVKKDEPAPAPVEVKPEVKPEPAPTQPTVATPEPEKPVEPAPEPEKPKIVWSPAVDPFPAVAGRPWPTDLHHLIDVKPPATIARAAPQGPFIVIVDQLGVNVYDLRTKRRTSLIKGKFVADDLLLSPDGLTLLVRNRPGASPAPSLDLWSVADGRMTRQITADTAGASFPEVLGFTRGNQVVTLLQRGGRHVAQVWDARTAGLVREIQLPEQLAGIASVGLSAGGRYLAAIVGERLTILDVDNGSAVCDAPVPHPAAQPRVISFSRDGGLLVAILAEGAAQHLVTWDAGSGGVLLDAPMPGGARQALTADQICWTPSGSAMLVGSDWIEPTTGTVAATLAPQTAGQSTGKPRMMCSDYHVLIEFLPAGSGQRVIYKAVSLPKRDIDAALAGRKPRVGASTAPSDVDEPSTAPADPSTTPPAPKSLPSTSSTTAPG